ncbi:hypothetical protein [Methylopila sp. Yamaguchi]|uniref:hypothetical protein n=1 Tax=Methylopila sp. Yamaguchi TaxID=1437817 RepID=UPI004037A83A
MAEPIQQANRWIFRAPLQAAYVRNIDFRVDSQGFLRDAKRHPQPPQIPGNKSRSIHRRKRPACEDENQ